MLENLPEILDNMDRVTAQLDEVRRQLLEFSSQKQHIFSNSTLQQEEFKRLLETDDWPFAIPPESLCISEDDKIERAYGIIDRLKDFNINIDGLKCLDYGCGEGHLVQAMAEKAAVSMGYDLTYEWEQIKGHAPYDVVVLYDVLDHAEEESPTDILKKIATIIHENSVIFIRFHPWCGRHGAHFYRTVNKAFIQLFFPKEELLQMGRMIPTTEIIYPIRMYKQWIKDAGLQIVENDISRSPVPDFFKQEPCLTKLVSIWGLDTFSQMDIGFADVIVSPKLKQ